MAQTPRNSPPLCPSCKKALKDPAGTSAPFCSKRCKLIDLGHWLDGDFSLPGEPAPPDEVLAAIDRMGEDPEKFRN
jgi:endogenous inhibitor of DNA gyrase (YacG/DUF329 family)